MNLHHGRSSHLGGRLRSVAAVALLASLLLLSSPRASALPVAPTTTGWPLSGAVRVLHTFDPPDTPWGSGHRGVDLRAAVGDPVLAAAAGRVTYAGLLAGRGVVVVDHGGVRTTYEPVAAVVRVGSRVSAGQMIGRLAAGRHCGATPCLHWGLRRGETYLDPLQLTGAPLTATGHVRLLPAAARAVAQRRASARQTAGLAQLMARLAGLRSFTP